MFRILPLVLACLFFAGCSHKTRNPPPEPVDFVAMTLGQAAEEAHGDLAMLARLRGQGLQPLVPPADPALAERISISWTGPADEAIKQVCLKTGYRYREMGTPSAQELSVVVHGLDMTLPIKLRKKGAFTGVIAAMPRQCASRPQRG